MQVNVDKIVVTLTLEDARVLHCVLKNVSGGDPYGEASRELNMDCNKVVKIGRTLEDSLASIVRAC